MCHKNEVTLSKLNKIGYIFFYQVLPCIFITSLILFRQLWSNKFMGLCSSSCRLYGRHSWPNSFNSRACAIASSSLVGRLLFWRIFAPISKYSSFRCGKINERLGVWLIYQYNQLIYFIRKMHSSSFLKGRHSWSNSFNSRACAIAISSLVGLVRPFRNIHSFAVNKKDKKKTESQANQIENVIYLLLFIVTFIFLFLNGTPFLIQFLQLPRMRLLFWRRLAPILKYSSFRCE